MNILYIYLAPMFYEGWRQTGACPEDDNQEAKRSLRKQKDMLEMLGAFSMEKRRLWGDMIAFFRYLTICIIEDGVGYGSPYLG